MKFFAKTKLIFLSGLLFFPALVSAQLGLKGLIIEVGRIINLLIPIAAALALLYFFWGLARFVWRSDSEEGREEGRQVMKWGIIALFVLVSIWGIVYFIQDQFGIGRYILRGPGEPGSYPYNSPYDPNNQDCGPLSC